MQHPIYIIAAADKDLGIGHNNKLAWHLPEELKHFQTVTQDTSDPNKENMVIMGRKTWESLPPTSRPLRNRKNVVLTRNQDFFTDQAHIAHSLKEAYEYANEHIEKIFIIGGASLYKEMIDRAELTGIYLTHLDKVFNCDSYFPPIPKNFHKKTLKQITENNINCEYCLYARN